MNETTSTPTTLKKVAADDAPTGPLGQDYLVSGKAASLRRWEQEPCVGITRSRDYETLGYVVEGKMKLELEGKELVLGPGDSWLVPAEAEHRYVVIDKLTAIEATSPPARFAGRDL